MDLAFYTYFYGSEKNDAFIITDIPSLEYKCYYYTNNKTLYNKLLETKWIPVYDDVLPPSTETSTNHENASNMLGKKVKIIPHMFKELQNHSFVCLIDNKLNNVNIKMVEELITKYFIEKNYALLIRKHWYIHPIIWHEFFDALKQPRYLREGERYNNYINRQLELGFKEKTEYHCATGFLLRNMKHEKMNEINDTWYEHLQECGIHCQISFFFVKQLFEESIFPFTEYPFLS